MVCLDMPDLCGESGDAGRGAWKILILLLSKAILPTVKRYMHCSRMSDPTVVVNFAAESHVDRSIVDPGLFLQTNILGTGVLTGRLPEVR